ncbi:MAG TPA: c-type cytochrome [Chloroflexota bacterium]
MGTAWPLVVGALVALLLGTACAPAAPATPAARVASAAPLARLTPAPGVAGDAARGRDLFATVGCGGCHTLRGLPDASGVTGPNLTNVTLRPTLAGESIPMTPDTLARWLVNPADVKPGSPMPSLGLSAEQARDVAAFLYSQPYNAAAH